MSYDNNAHLKKAKYLNEAINNQKVNIMCLDNGLAMLRSDLFLHVCKEEQRRVCYNEISILKYQSHEQEVRCC